VTILFNTQTLVLKNLVAESNMFQGIIQYNAEKLVSIVIQVNTEVFRIKGNTH